MLCVGRNVPIEVYTTLSHIGYGVADIPLTPELGTPKKLVNCTEVRLIAKLRRRATHCLLPNQTDNVHF